MSCSAGESRVCLLETGCGQVLAGSRDCVPVTCDFHLYCCDQWWDVADKSQVCLSETGCGQVWAGSCDCVHITCDFNLYCCDQWWGVAGESQVCLLETSCGQVWAGSRDSAIYIINNHDVVTTADTLSEHTDALVAMTITTSNRYRAELTAVQYWYRNCICLSVCHAPVLYRNDLTYYHTFFSI